MSTAATERLQMPPNVEYRHIQWRADGNPVSNGAVRVVPYLEAWACAYYLDLWVGPANWTDSYEATSKDGVMWCHIDVRDPLGGWVRHSDVGTASTYEAAKGLVSDAFKRCAQRKWGIGRNIYELPGPLWIPTGTYRTYRASSGKDVVVLNEKSEAEILRQLHARGVAITEQDVAVEQTDAPAPAEDLDHQAMLVGIERHADDLVEAGRMSPDDREQAIAAARKSADSAKWVAAQMHERDKAPDTRLPL